MRKSSFGSVASFLAGFGAMIEEVVWFRLLGTILGSDVWASSLVLAIFLGGLGLGSILSALLVSWRNWGAKKTFWLAQFFLALFAVFSPLLFHGLGVGYGISVGIFPFWTHGALALGIAFSALLVPCCAMGMTVPLLMESMGEEETLSYAGLLYGFNNLGGVLGVFLCGFFLMEHGGIWGCVLISGLSHMLSAWLGVKWLR
ncbi:MAG: hypothetical protein HY400_01440 [Elusimicrobia bacterium]|nr:hypothetical protein [Elusimicrobiota bacterium]